MSHAHRPRRRRLADLAAVLLGVLAAAPAGAATRYDPALRFRSITTPHFVIHFHQGEEELAHRLASVAEEVHRTLTTRMGVDPRGRTHVVLVDQSDEPNGWATPLPYNLVEITAAEPSGASLIGNTRDWLRLVFTHEYAHVLHLDRSRGWARAARAIFGRVPFAFPNLTLPLWHIEGLATFEESEEGRGRLHAGDFHAVVGEAARAGRFEPLDRVNGGLADWPGGHGWYAYGGFFHAFLAERYGRAKLRELSDRTAGRLPYVTSGAFRDVFGRSLGELWQEFRERERPAPPPATSPDVTRLTFGGFVVDGPRFESVGGLVYTRADPHGLPRLERLSPGGRVERLTSRLGGEQSSLADEAVYFDQLELHRNVALHRDLYRLDRRSGAVVRLTNGMRAADPDVSPDGGRLAVVVTGAGRRDLVIVPRPLLDAGAFAAGRLPPCPAQAGTACVLASGAWFSRPRWSPDGRAIVVESRHRTEGVSDLVTIETDTGRSRVLVSSTGRNVTPVWAPDGRSVVFASDRSGVFDLYRVWMPQRDGAAPRIQRLTELAGGAHSPDISPGGQSIVFVGYTPGGYDLFSMDLPPDPGEETAQPMAPNFRPAPTQHHVAPNFSSAATIVSTPYSPWTTLRPRSWLPVVELDDDQVEAGAATSGVDALGYHAWVASATWPVMRSEAFSGLPSQGRPDFLVAYAYDRWRPTLFVQAEDDTFPLLVGRAGSAERRPFLVRDQTLTAGVSVPFRRLRWSHAVTAAWDLEHRVVEAADARTTVNRGSVRAGWAVSSAKRFGYSISPERGVSAGIGVEVARPAFGADADSTFSRADVRAFLPAFPLHGVLAARASVAAARGDVRGRRTIRLGGADGDPDVASFEEDATSLLRGFPSNAFQGTTAALLNVEYRVPLGWPQRGVGTWPVFLRSVHATAFYDAGHAWTGAFRMSDVKSSWGAEISADVTAAYALPLTVTAGIAWGRDSAGGVPSNREVYVRLGHGF